MELEKEYQYLIQKYKKVLKEHHEYTFSCGQTVLDDAGVRGVLSITDRTDNKFQDILFDHVPTYEVAKELKKIIES